MAIKGLQHRPWMSKAGKQCLLFDNSPMPYW